MFRHLFDLEIRPKQAISMVLPLIFSSKISKF
jgi:hypothetical protein